MSVDSAGMAARLGIKPGMVVQELGWDEDADEDLRDAVIELSGGEMVDEDTDEVADVVAAVVARGRRRPGRRPGRRDRLAGRRRRRLAAGAQVRAPGPRRAR